MEGRTESIAVLQTLKPRPRVRARVKVSRGAMLAAASAVAYGALVVLAKLAYAEGWNVPSLLAARFGLAALTILPFALRQRYSARAAVAGFVVGAIGYAGTTALYFPSFHYLPAAVSSFLLYLSPMLVALLSWLLLREPLGGEGRAGLVIALAGLAILSSGAWTGELPAVGVALALGSAVVFAFTVVASRRLVAETPWAQASLWVCLGACASYLAFSTATGQLRVPPSAWGIAYAVGIGTLATGVALSLFFMALERVGASRTAVISTLEPVSTLILAAVFLAEIPGVAGVVGGLLIVVAAALIATQEPLLAQHE